LLAFVILLVGWLVAGLAQRVVRSLLRRTRVDEVTSSAATPADRQGEPLIRFDRIIAAVTFWVVLILEVVAALSRLELTAASEPFNQFINQIFALPAPAGRGGDPGDGGLDCWSLAWMVVRRLSSQFQLDEKLLEEKGSDATPGLMVSETLANALYWLNPSL